MNIKKHSTKILFCLLCTCAIILNFVVQEFLFTEEIYYNELGEQASYEQIAKMVTSIHRYGWVVYLAIPVVYLVQFVLISSCIYTGAVVFYNESRIRFSDIFRFVVKSEFVFLIPSVIYILWFALFDKNYTLADLQSFFPLSLQNIVELDTSNDWMGYVLQTLNFFEVIYIITLAFCLTQVSKQLFEQNLKLILCSYGLGLILWVLVVTWFKLAN